MKRISIFYCFILFSWIVCYSYNPAGIITRQGNRKVQSQRSERRRNAPSVKPPKSVNHPVTSSPQKEKSTQSPDARLFNNIKDKWDATAYKDFLLQYPNSEFSSEVKNRLSELELWNKASVMNTEEAYQNYLNKTKYSRYSKNAVAQIKKLQQDNEKSDWEYAIQINTVEGYKRFINEYPFSDRAKEARNRIDEVQAQNEWNLIKHKADIFELQNFIKRFPKFSGIDRVNSLIHALKSNNYYQSGDLENAVIEYKKITDSSDISSDLNKNLTSIKELTLFSGLSPDSTIEDLEEFLFLFPNSQYLYDVRNYIAIKKASNFNSLSTKSDYNDALSYATGNVRDIVNYSIKDNEMQIKKEKNQEKNALRAQHGGWFGFLFGMELQGNGRNEDGRFHMNWDFRLGIGNSYDRVQGSIALKPGFAIWDYKGNYNGDPESREVQAYFSMPLELGIKLNVADLGETEWGESKEHSFFYIEGRYDFNICRNQKVEPPMAYKLGIGFCIAAHVNYYFFYGHTVGSINYKYNSINGLPNPFRKSKNNHIIGAGFTIRF